MRHLNVAIPPSSSDVARRMVVAAGSDGLSKEEMRFWDKVQIEPKSTNPVYGCWLWTGSTDRYGYGTFKRTGSKNPDRAGRARMRLFALIASAFLA